MSGELTGMQSDNIDEQFDAVEMSDAASLDTTLREASEVQNGEDRSASQRSALSQPIAPFSPVVDHKSAETVMPLIPEDGTSEAVKQTVKQTVKHSVAQSVKQSDRLSNSGNSLQDLEDLPEQSAVQAFAAVPDTGTSKIATLPREHNNTKDSLLNTSSSSDDVDQLDPLMRRPRVSTILWCMMLAVVFLISAVGLWLLSVQTVLGQSYEEMVISGFGSHGVPPWLSFCLRPLCISFVVIILGAIIAVAALSIVCIRKRWWMLGQCACIIILAVAAEPLKKMLPRPMLINIEYLSTNSAPSGHALVIAAACALLICAVSRAWRAWTALGSAVISILVQLSLIAGHWHRSSDVLISLLIVGAVTLAVLAGTRSSGMDMPAYRRSSISVQIVGSSMITLGALACLYAVYLIWQILPGVDIFAQWASGVSYIATYWLIIGVSLLVYGVIMVMRHATAAPLSRLGLVGAPPTPPSAA